MTEIEAILRELKTYGGTDQQIADCIGGNRVTINRLRNGKPSRGETGESYLPALRQLLATARASKQSQQSLPEASIVDSLPPQEEQKISPENQVSLGMQSTSRAIDILRSQQIDIRPQLMQHVVMPQTRVLEQGEGYRPDTGFYRIQEIPQSPYERAMDMIHARSNQRRKETEMRTEMERQGQIQTGGYGRYCRVCGLHPIGTPCSYA